MEINSTNGFGQAAAVQGNLPQGEVTTSRNELGMDDFFKLLTTQLTSQDPLKPMEDTEFIAQMASFSSLAQMENIADSMADVRVQQESSNVISLLGKEIRATDRDGETLEGTVTGVEWQDGKLVPFVGPLAVPYESIIQIWDSPSDASESDAEGDTQEEDPNP